MNADRTTPSERSDMEAQTDDDLELKQALSNLQPPVDAARVEALSRRVLAQWQDARGAAAEPAAGAAGGARGGLALHGGWRRRWMVGATGLAVGLALVIGTWLRSSDPALDELLQPDVLSQMAAGEM